MYIPTYLPTLQQKLSMYAKWFQWILGEFISLMNRDYWTTPTFCSSVVIYLPTMYIPTYLLSMYIHFTYLLIYLLGTYTLPTYLCTID
jgi:hypothetical protein